MIKCFPSKKDHGEKPSRNAVVFRNNRIGIWFLFLALGAIGKNHNYLEYLKVDGWTSEYESVQNVLTYLKKSRNGSEGSKKSILFHIYRLCLFCNLKPNELIKKDKPYLDKKIKSLLYSLSNPSTANTYKNGLKTFFRENNMTDLEYPTFKNPSRDETSKTSITLEDAWKMVRYAPSVKAALLILLLFTTGLRSSTIRAIKIGVVNSKNPLFKKYTIMDELARGEKNPMIVIHIGMKKLLNRACRCGIFYYVFIHDCAMEYLINHLKEMERKHGKIDKNYLLFPSEDRKLPFDKRCTTPMSDSNINYLVKTAARLAGIKDHEKISAKTLRDLYYDTLKKNHLITGMSYEDREFFMGHSLGKPVENYFNIEKITDMQKLFSKLSFDPGSQKSNLYLETLARSNGINYEFALEWAKDKYGKDPTEKEIEKVINELVENNNEFVLAKPDEVLSYLNKGYRIENSPSIGKKTVMSKKILSPSEVKTNQKTQEKKSFDKDRLKEYYKKWFKEDKEKEEKLKESVQKLLSDY